jgi:hypothetical protein
MISISVCKGETHPLNKSRSLALRRESLINELNSVNEFVLFVVEWYSGKVANST